MSILQGLMDRLPTVVQFVQRRYHRARNTSKKYRISFIAEKCRE